MIRVLTLSALLLSLFGMAPVAKADDPAVVAARVVAAIRDAADATSDRIQTQTQAAVARIDALDKDGASDRVIIAAGRRSIDQLDATAANGKRRVATIRADGVQRLRSLNAAPDLIERVNQAARRAIEGIDQRHDRGTRAIRKAVQDAIG